MASLLSSGGTAILLSIKVVWRGIVQNTCGDINMADAIADGPSENVQQLISVKTLYRVGKRQNSHTNFAKKYLGNNN